MSEPVGHVAELWRYPVKSMGGTQVTSVRLDTRGVHADRLWAVRDLTDRRTTSARRLPALLRCVAAYAEEPGPLAGPGHPVPVLVTLPDGEQLASGDPRLDARLSDLCGRDVALVPLPRADDTSAHRGGLTSAAAVRRELGLADGEPLPDASAMPVRTLAALARWSTPPGSFVDIAPVQLLTTRAVQALGEALAAGADADDAAGAGAEDGPGGLAVRRFRPSVLVELTGDGLPAYPEREWVGHHLHVGPEAALPVTMPTVRCVVPTREQPGLPRRQRLSRALVELDDRFLGVYADVARPGSVQVGNEVRLVHHEPGAARSALAR
ncbi:MAG: sulfurase, partial [Marmoricola sp.]|nr:sulfurase [Marmoricola sp.]